MSIERPKRRARRIAADEAHAWARNLRLRNPFAKLVLSMLTLYVDSDGTCFVSIPTLAEDTELSPGTVRDRLAFLEEAGAIQRIEQWEDRFGRRNTDGEGRQTSDLIVLKIERDERDLEADAAAAVARRAAAAARSAPLPTVQGDPPTHGAGGDSAGTPPGLQRPFDSAEGLISEPEPEPESPQAPEGGERERHGDFEPEDFAPAWQSWPGHEVMRRDLALDAFIDLPLEKQRHCRAAIPHFIRRKQHLKQDHFPNFHTWIKHRGFEEFPTAQLAATSGEPVMVATSHSVDSREGRALKAMFRLSRAMLFEHGGKVVYPLPMTAGVLAFADLPPERDWVWVDQSSRAQVAAWSKFFAAHVHIARAQLVRTIGAGDTMRSGFQAPWPWPPRKDGTISDSGDEGEAA